MGSGSGVLGPAERPQEGSGSIPGAGRGARACPGTERPLAFDAWRCAPGLPVRGGGGGGGVAALQEDDFGSGRRASLGRPSAWALRGSGRGRRFNPTRGARVPHDAGYLASAESDAPSAVFSLLFQYPGYLTTDDLLFSSKFDGSGWAAFLIKLQGKDLEENRTGLKSESKSPSRDAAPQQPACLQGDVGHYASQDRSPPLKSGGLDEI